MDWMTTYTDPAKMAHWSQGVTPISGHTACFFPFSTSLPTPTCGTIVLRLVRKCPLDIGDLSLCGKNKCFYALWLIFLVEELLFNCSHVQKIIMKSKHQLFK